MIVVLKPDCRSEERQAVVQRIEALGLGVHLSEGRERTIIGAIGDERVLRESGLESLAGVERIVPILKPFKLVSREFQHDDTVIEVDGARIGGNHVQVIAGPCAVESEGLLMEIAAEVKAAGCRFLRGGAYKPRTSPYSFQGLEREGLRLLARARREFGLKTVSELVDARDLRYFDEVDIIQIGARNSQNFRLLQELGRIGKPILLKRGLSGTLNELLMSAEYIASGGNRRILLCERGIRTYEPETRNTLDISAVPVLSGLSHLPVAVDPSHSGGKRELVEPLALAGVAAGAQALLVDVHTRPEEALCDGPQALTPELFRAMMDKIRLVSAALGRTTNQPLNTRVPKTDSSAPF